MYCSCPPSWKTMRSVLWTISLRSCSILLQADSTYFHVEPFFCIPFSLFSRFCVILVSLSSFSFWMLVSSCSVSFNSVMSCQSWLKFSSFEFDFTHVASFTMLDFFMWSITHYQQVNKSSKMQIVWYSINFGYYINYTHCCIHYPLSYSNRHTLLRTLNPVLFKKNNIHISTMIQTNLRKPQLVLQFQWK